MSEAAERLQKVLAAAGLGSRRAIEAWIEAGRVTVNGRAATLGQRVSTTDKVTLDGRPLRLNVPVAPLPRVLAYNKPEGEICSRHDPEGRPTVFERLPVLRGARWVSVGRLDINTTGLLLLTDSGELANRLMRPAGALEREYVVRVAGAVDDAMLARLRNGVALDDDVAAFDEVREQGGSGFNRWFAVSLREGRNREVRRLWESQGCSVSRLKRVRFGPVVLGPRERRGTWRELDATEVTALCASVGLEPRVAVAPAVRREAAAGDKAAARNSRRASVPEGRRKEPGRGRPPRRTRS